MKGFALAFAISAVGALGLLGPRWAGSHWLERDEPPAQAPVISSLQSEFRAMRSELADVLKTVEDQVERAREMQRIDGERRERLAHVVARTEDGLQAYAREVQECERRLAELGGEGADAAAIEARFAALGDELEQRWQGLSHLVDATQTIVGENRQELAELSSARVRDVVGMWRSLVGPVVQLAGDSSVGSGVLLESHPLEDRPGWETFLITAWHVVRDIQETPDRRDMPVPVAIYSEDGSIRSEVADLVRFDVELDVALLRLRSARPVENGARLAPRQRIVDVHTFDRIYAVGCPLGNDPIPTPGEVSAAHHEVDGQAYWMINAATFIGNSGGGIFDAETRELLGIFSKIYNYGSLRPTIVPHMGLATPLDRIYDWLDENGYSALAPKDDGEAVVHAGRGR